MNNWINGIVGVIVGDALGCPVQFMSREEIAARGPVTGMEGHGSYNMPAGTWTDDGSMTLALLDSINICEKIDLDDIMRRFLDWYDDGKYTQYGKSFDIGNTCASAIERYRKDCDVTTCGGRSDRSNGNGSLMRIMPACLYAYENGLAEKETVKMIHDVSGLTHNHLRSKIACGLYYFCVKAILDEKGLLSDRLQAGLDAGFRFYEADITNLTELAYYGRLRDIGEFSMVDASDIRTTGYVVDSLEAAIWCLTTTDSFKECLLKTVNLGDDTDTVAAIAGGLAGLYYKYSAIPSEWLETIKDLQRIVEMCDLRRN